MSKKNAQALVIVESPAKIKTLTNFLGTRFKVMASMGHVRDLPKSTLGVNVEEGFQPTYRNIRDRKKTLEDLQKAVQKADEVYLASDPDREGEAIAWHLAQALKLESPLRIEFNEITRQAVETALKHPRTIDMDRVNSQQARRVLDRLVGYKLSPLLWRKVGRRNLSAGRVQSVAVRIIVDREREIENFQPEEYWTISALLTPETRDTPFEARLIQREGKKLEIHNAEEVAVVKQGLEGVEYRVASVKPREKVRNPSPPFITSTLQQEAAIKLGFGSRKTMTVAQQLYEGLDLGAEGTMGLITYMRTDSTRVAAEAQAEARDYIEKHFGQQYVPEKPREFKSRKAAQEAHEAIRPTSVHRHPELVKQHLTRDQYRLYELIWKRFVASQMRPAILDVVTVDISAGDYTFRATGSSVKFPGFMRVYVEGKEDSVPNPEEESETQLPVLTAGELLRLLKLTDKQHFTEPPPRYSEATLVKALEEQAIGRPSTYATIVQTIQDRGYVVLENKRFRPTDLGRLVTDLLVRHFPDILGVEFTARMEQDLDQVEEGDIDWVGLLTTFYPPFIEKVTQADETEANVKLEPRISEEMCPECGKPMAIKQSRYGEFLGCTGYPTCRKILPLAARVGVKCPQCGGDIVEKRSKKRKLFYGCSRYPECNFVAWYKPVDKHCPDCGSLMGERSGRSKDLVCLNKTCPRSRVSGQGSSVDGPLESELPEPAIA